MVGNQRYQAIEIPPEPDVYISYAQVPQRSGYLFLRTSADPAALAPAVRREVRVIDPNLPVYDIQTMDQRVGAATARTRVTGALLAWFAAAALILSLAGTYGVIGYAVTQRRREIGVRIALGAQRSAVAGMVLRQSAALAALGLGTGLAGAWATTRLLQSLLYQVEPTDPQVLVLVAAGMLITAFAASSIPILRAMRTDPLAAIKTE